MVYTMSNAADKIYCVFYYKCCIETVCIGTVSKSLYTTAHHEKIKHLLCTWYNITIRYICKQRTALFMLWHVYLIIHICFIHYTCSTLQAATRYCKTLHVLYFILAGVCLGARLLKDCIYCLFHIFCTRR
jgi:hypothetical protein